MADESFFVRTGARTFEPTAHAGGAWSDEDHHFAPLAGLLVHEMENARRAGAPDQLARVSFDILGRLPFTGFEVTVEVVRPGRTIELVQATMTSGERPVLTARAWYLAAFDSSAGAGVEEAAIEPPHAGEERDMTATWPGGFIAQIVSRQVSTPRPGASTTWITSPNTLVAGEDSHDVAEFIARVDAANGVAPRGEPGEWAFPNVDLTVHLFRRPDPQWTGLDTTVSWGPDGVGLTSSVLHDVHGPVGRANQCLTVRKG